MRPALSIWGALCLAAGLTGGASQAQTPLSIIDWLETEDAAAPGTAPPVAGSALQPQIDVQPIASPTVPVGLVPPGITGLPVDVWKNSDPATLTRLIAKSPVTDHPALQSLLYSLLLTEAAPPSDPAWAQTLLLARVDKLLDLGALDPAKALIEAAGPTTSPALFARWSDTAFLTGSEDDVCALLVRVPHLAPNRETVIFCAARMGDLNRATLLFDTSLALDDLENPPRNERWVSSYLKTEGGTF